MIGTQQLVKKVPFTVQVQQTRDLCSNIIKCRHDEDGLQEVLDDPKYKYYFIWFRSYGKSFTSGKVDFDTEYGETYRFVMSLLDKYHDQDKVFCLGNWEGDWYLLPDKNKTIDAPQERIQGMIEWHQIRFSALRTAREKFPQSRAKVYYYIEMNRVTDAWEKNMKRIVNEVLPHVQTDFVSLSSWELQEKSTEDIASIFDYINSYANYSDTFPWEQKIMIGEFGIPSVRFNYDGDKHSEANIEIYNKFKALDCPFILYWAMHNNELKPDGRPKGLWLVNDDGEKVPFFYTMQKMCIEQGQGQLGP